MSCYNKYNMFKSEIQRATAFKDQGNQFFRMKNYQKAIECYTISINIHPLVQAYSNRGITKIHMQNYEEALEDCENALKIDKNHVKSILRKGKSLIYLLRIDEGIKFLQGETKPENMKSANDIIALGNKIKQSIESYKSCRAKNDFVKALASLNEFYPSVKNNLQVIISIIQCLGKTNKNEALQLLKNIQASIDQTCFTYWYLRSIIELSHGLKAKANKYLLQSIRYFTTKPLKQIEKTMLIEFKRQNLTGLLENIAKSEKMINETHTLMSDGKHKQAIKKINSIIDMDAISSEQKLSMFLLRSKCYKKTKQKPKELNDLNTLISMRPNHVQALQARLQFYEIERFYKQALKDAQTLNKITSKHLYLVQRLASLAQIPEPQKLDYYQILDVSQTATKAEISKAYKQLAIIYHPDKNRVLGEQEQQFAKNKFKEIKKAQVCLTDQQKRQFYNRHRCEPDELDERNLMRSGGFDIFNLFKSADLFFGAGRAGGSRGPPNQSRGNFNNFSSQGFSFSFTPNNFPFSF